MSAVQVLTGRGGWPMTVWLTPDRKPFFGGTYFPARDGDRGARVGLPDAAARARARPTTTQPDEVARDAPSSSPRPIRAEPGARAGRDAAARRARSLDGGRAVLPRALRLRRTAASRGAPKFPSSLPVRLPAARPPPHRRRATRCEMATLTLEKMARGRHLRPGRRRLPPLLDRRARGWCRTSRRCSTTTRCWRWPTSRPTRPPGDEDFARVAREILRYVEREMTSPDGGLLLGDRRRQPDPERAARRRAGSSPGRRPRSRPSLGPERAAAWSRRTTASRAAGNFDGRNILHVAAAAAPRWRASSARRPDELAAVARGSRDAALRARAPAAAAAARREDPDRLERADDLGLRPGGARARRRGATSKTARRAAEFVLDAHARGRPAAAQLQGRPGRATTPTSTTTRS